MHSIFKTFFLSLCIVANVHFAYAQGIIPNGKATFLDRNGKPLANGKVYFYIPNTTTAKPTYQDINQSIQNTQPVILDTSGRALLWGTGNYRQQVFDQNSNLIWDVTTTVSGTGGSTPTSTGDGDLVGTIKPWAGAVAPNQYMLAYGQTINRVTYSALLTAITTAANVNCTNGSPTITGLTDTTSFWIGEDVEVACVLTGASTIVSKTSSTVVLAANATSSLNTTATFFPWGHGDGSTTFALPDLRGLIPVGNNNMGGSASSNLTTAFFGSTNPNSIGAAGGAQSKTITLATLPTGITVTGPITTSTSGGNTFPILSGNNWGGPTQVNPGAVSNVPIANNTVSSASSLTGTANLTSNNTSGSAFGVVPPSKTVNYIIKVTPDANSASSSGVTSLGSMTGDIACGTGLLCTGNNISVSGAIVTSITPDGGLVSSVTANCSQSAIISTGTLSSAECVNAQTGTTYAILDGDRAKLITASNASAQAYSIAQAGAATAFVAGWYTDVCNISTNLAGIVTITPTTSTINGAATFKLQPNVTQCVRIVSDGTNYQVVDAHSGAQLPGTTTNDAANAGNVGEYVVSNIASGSAVSLSNTTPANMTSINLTAGDWDVSADYYFVSGGSASVTALLCSISQTSATSDTTTLGAANFNRQSQTVTTSFINQLVGPLRISLSAGSTTIYAVTQGNFTAATLTVYGQLRARRVR